MKELPAGMPLFPLGYDSKKKIGVTRETAYTHCWGTEWSFDSYDCLPYAYTRTGLAVDLWSRIKAEFVETWLFD
jgi:C1A family cysteine protease